MMTQRCMGKWKRGKKGDGLPLLDCEREALPGKRFCYGCTPAHDSLEGPNEPPFQLPVKKAKCGHMSINTFRCKDCQRAIDSAWGGVDEDYHYYRLKNSGRRSHSSI